MRLGDAIAAGSLFAQVFCRYSGWSPVLGDHEAVTLCM